MARTKPPIIQGFQVADAIGSGAFSKVFRAQHPVSSELVAIKVITYQGGQVDSKIVKEVKMHRILKHANILEVLGTEVDEDGSKYKVWGPAFFIILEYASGGDLFDKIGTLPTLVDTCEAHCLNSSRRRRFRRDCAFLLLPTHGRRQLLSLSRRLPSRSEAGEPTHRRPWQPQVVRLWSLQLVQA
jgi:hypothetical protein